MPRLWAWCLPRRALQTCRGRCAVWAGRTEQNSVYHAAPMVQVPSEENICHAWVVCFSCHPENPCISGPAVCCFLRNNHPETPTLHPDPAIFRKLEVTFPPMAAHLRQQKTGSFLIPGAAQVRSDVVLGLCAGITLSVNASEVLKPGIESERMSSPPPPPPPQGHLGFELLEHSPVKAMPVKT